MSQERVDPTLLLPDEPMVYEIKKKKKKKKKKECQEDPLKGCAELGQPVVIEYDVGPEDLPNFDPEVTIKVENIEVDLGFNEFPHDTGEVMECDDTNEPPVSIDNNTNHNALILTYQKVSKKKKKLKKHKKRDEHICNVCQLSFLTIRTLRIHKYKKHNIFIRDLEHVCEDCGMSYEQKNSLIAHIRRKHTNGLPEDTEPQTCNICSFIFKGTVRLKLHMQRKHDINDEIFKYECVKCGLKYDKHSSLITHNKRKHSDKPEKKRLEFVTCPHCSKVFRNRDSYMKHLQRTHSSDKVVKTEDMMENVKLEQENKIEIQCSMCPLVFTSIKHKNLHLRRKHSFKQEAIYKCRLCKLSYERAESLKRHLREKHSGNLYCNICEKKYESEDVLLNHTHQRPIIECSTCGLIFASRGGLQKHMRCTHKMEMGPLTVFCQVCKAGFTENRHLKKHLLRVHLQVTYPCNFCSKIFKTKESFRRHSWKFHPSNYPTNEQAETTHLCHDCGAIFLNEQELNSHLESSHMKQEIKREDAIKIKQELVENNVTTYQCQRCVYTCDSFEMLRQHYEEHHYIDQIQCTSCGDLVARKDLNKHMKSAHTIDQNKCQFCEFTTESKSSLSQHMLRHKNVTSIDCEYPNCRYKSFYKHAMEKHKQKHAEMGVKLQCASCPFQTMNKYILKYHEEEHSTGKKKYACNQCDYSTILPANLVQHKYKHSQIKRFKCEFCPFATKYNTSLRFHVRKKHCDLPSKT